MKRHLLAAACLSLLFPLRGRSQEKLRPADLRLSVHEWGTFTRSGGRQRGRPLFWVAGKRKRDDLPASSNTPATNQFKGRACRGTIRMENPLFLYFYAKPTPTTRSPFSSLIRKRMLNGVLSTRLRAVDRPERKGPTQFPGSETPNERANASEIHPRGSVWRSEGKAERRRGQGEKMFPKGKKRKAPASRLLRPESAKTSASSGKRSRQNRTLAHRSAAVRKIPLLPEVS